MHRAQEKVGGMTRGGSQGSCSSTPLSCSRAGFLVSCSIRLRDLVCIPRDDDKMMLHGANLGWLGTPRVTFHELRVEKAHSDFRPTERGEARPAR